MALNPVLMSHALVPSAPTLVYSGTTQGLFTISNWAANITYTGSGCTISGDQVTVTAIGTPATVTAKYTGGINSSSSSALTLQHQWLNTGVVYTIPADEGCSPRGDQCCPTGYLNVTTGQTCGTGPGTQQDGLCSGGCAPGDCYYRGAVDCYSRALTDYSSSGYVLTGSVWGKAVNA